MLTALGFGPFDISIPECTQWWSLGLILAGCKEEGRRVQSIQLGFMFSCIHVTTILSNTYLTKFSKNLAELNDHQTV